MEYISANRRAKMDEAAEVKEIMASAASTVLLGFKGLNVAQVTELRARFRKQGVKYRVVKNNLIRQALKGSAFEGNEQLDKTLIGETGLAFSFEDPSLAAKIVKGFRKEDEKNEKLEVKAGLLDTSVLNGQQVETNLASLPSREELLGKIVAMVQAPAAQLLAQILAPGQTLAGALAAQKKQLEGGA